MKKIFKKAAIFAIAGVTVFASCKKDDKKLGSIGHDPKIPTWAQSAPTSKEALAATWNALPAEFSGVIPITMSGSDYVFATRTISSKGHDVVATTDPTYADMFHTIKDTYDSIFASGGEAALEQALEEAGITNFNWNDTGISYNKDGYEVFYKVTGSWAFTQGPSQ